MIRIELLDKIVCGEPGPNFYWYGNPEDFFELSNNIRPLALGNNFEIVLPALIYGKKSHVYLQSKEKSKILNSYSSELNRIYIILDKKIWQEIVLHFDRISFEKSRVYLDMENFNLSEYANFIIDSNF